MIYLLSSTGDFSFTLTGDTCAHELGHNIINNLSHSENQVFNNSIQVSSSQAVTFNIPIQFVLGGDSDDQGALTTNSGDKYQAVHFGSGLTNDQASQLSQDLVRLIGSVDDEDLNEMAPLHEDEDVNRIIYAMMRRRGWNPNESWDQHLNVLPPSMIMTSDETQDIANMVLELKSSGAWDKIYAMYLPVFRDTNVNKINFKCPDSNNIETWNALEQSDASYAGFTRAGLLSQHYNLLSNSTIPAPKAMYSADQIDQELGSRVHTWMDLTSNGNHLTSKPNPLALPSEESLSPVLVDDADIFDKKIGVRFNHRSHRLVFNDGNPVNRDDFKHVFIVYRMDNWIDNGRRGTVFDFGQTINYTKASLGLGHDDYSYGSPTQFYGGWSVKQLNGWNTSKVWPTPYYNRSNDRWYGGYSNYGLNPHPSTSTHLRTAGDDPTWMYGPRIVHVKMSSSQPEQLSGFTLGNNSSDVNGWSVRGCFHDVIIYDQELTTDQVNYVTSYLAMKHDVSIHPSVTNNRSIYHNKQQNNSVTFARDVHNGVATPFTTSEAFPDQSGGAMIIKSLADQCVDKTYDIRSSYIDSTNPYIGATSSFDRTPPGMSMQNFSSSGVDTIISPGLTPDSQTSYSPPDNHKKMYMMCKMAHFSNWRAKPANASSDSYTGFYFFNQQLTTQQIQSVSRSHQLLMKNLGGSTASDQTQPYDSDGEISAYVNKLASKTGKTYDEMMDDPRVTSVIDFIKRGKSVGWWDRIAVCYFPVWRDQELNELNLKDPGLYDLQSEWNVDHCRGPWTEAIGNTAGGNWFVESMVIPVNIPTIHTLCCQPDMNVDDWTTMHYHFTVHYKRRNTSLSWGNSNYTGFGTGNTMIRVHPFRYSGWGSTSIDWGCGATDGGAFKYQTSGTYFESVEGVGDIYSKWNDTTVIRTRDCSTNTTPVTTSEFYLHPGGGHAGNQVDFFALGVKMDHNTELDMINDYVEAVDQLTATLVDTVSSAGATTIATSTNPITIHGAANLHNTDQTTVLIAAKNDLTIYDQQVPESLETASQPFTAIWDDDRVWNFSPGNDYHYGSMYNTHVYSFNSTSLTPCEIGWRMRTYGNGYPSTNGSAPGGNIATLTRGQNCFIRGRQSGAIRRSTFGYKNNTYNDDPTSGVNEDRILKFKILDDASHRGVFIAGGSPPWRVNDVSGWSGSSVYFPGSGSMNSSDNWYGSKRSGPVQDQFWNNLSNDVSFIPGEPIDIVNFDNIGSSCGVESVYNRRRGAPVQDNISFFNGKYRVAEVTDLQQPLEDGDVFDSENNQTHGGPDQPNNPGEGTPLRAWMRIDMTPIETIDIGPTNQHDLVLFANTTMSESVSADWINRFYLGGVAEHKYKLHVDNKDNMYVCGTYTDHMVVNYNLDLNEKYSVVLDEFGEPQDQPPSSSSGENSQAFVTMHDPVSGQVVTCLSTRGVGKNRGSSAIANSDGDIYMTGQVSGKVRFVADHGWWKYTERGVNTGDTHNTFGFLAKATNKEWRLNNTTKYKPIDYTWEWIVYVDAPTHALSGDRMLCDVGVDTNDDVYTIGYFDGPTEIGMSGAAKHDDSESFQFEPGYKWVDESDEQLFTCKWTDTGKCVWSNVYGVTGLNRDSIHMTFHDDTMYFVCAAETFTSSTTESGVIITQINILTGESIWTKSIQGGSITCSSIKVTDSKNIFITGACDSTISSSNITLGGGAEVQSQTGYSLLLESTGASGVVTIFTSTETTCDHVTQSTSTGKGVTVGTCDSDINIQSGTQSIDIQTPEQNKYFIYKSTHEL